MFIMIFGAYCSYNDKEPIWYITTDVITGVLFIFLGLGFWFHNLHSHLGWIPMVFYAVAMGWEMASTPYDLRSILQDEENTILEKTVIVIIAILCAVPMYIISGLAVLKK